MNKVCLVTPPSDFLLDQRVFPNLGILKVGAVLERAGIEVDHLDLTGVANYEEVACDYPEEATFALTATTPQIPAAVKVRDVIREAHPNSRIILGGPHATLIHSAAKRGIARAQRALEYLVRTFDSVVAGDGEKAIFVALERDGIVDADDPKSLLWQSSQDFTENPWPARHLLDLESYQYSIEGARALHLISQLGCPMACNFCSGRNSPMLRRIRLRPPENVIAEVTYLHDTYGCSAYNFFDDELNVNRLMLELMRQMKRAADERGVEWKLRGFIKAELFTEEQAEAMYAAGFRWILIGFESGSDRILLNINKKATRDENSRALEIAHAHGIKVKALMSLGHAGESESTVDETHDWLLDSHPDDVDVTVITPYPGSPYWDDAVHVVGDAWCYTAPKTSDRLYMDDVDFVHEADYYKGAPGAYVSHVWTDHLDRHNLVALRDKLEDKARKALGIPYPTAAAALNFEHSMGQRLPEYILRGSK